MRPLFKCELNYFESKHLSQIFAGFEILSKKGIVEVVLKDGHDDFLKPVLKVLVNDRFSVVYDMLDGLNWVEGNLKDNLEYFRNNITADYYFKRSFDQQIIEYAPAGCKVYPLGLNYNIAPKHLHRRNAKDSLKNFLRNSRFAAKYLKINDSDIYSEQFEYYPVPNKTNSILFLARLWDPAEVKQENLKAEREMMNAYRIECIRLCQREFGKQFTGGLQMDHYSMTHCKDLIVPFELTRRETYLNTVKESNICIATAGLHESIGFKMGEYVAAARAIVSEPLRYVLPGNFDDGSNYLSFLSPDELVQNARKLCDDKEVMITMMKNNNRYYQNYLRPDVLVLNTLSILNEE
jgi:hypothetical protein